MRLNKTAVLVIILLAIMGLFYQFTSSGYNGPAYIEEPFQKDLKTVDTIRIDGQEGAVELDLLAKYKISAVVKNIKNYTRDYTSQISPRDFVLAWGDINQPSIDKDVSYSQKNRWYYFTVKSGAKVNVNYVDLYSANTHIIPANKDIEQLSEQVKKNDYITMEGYLVNANFVDGYWHTSLTRDDTGDGSCEIMYVTRLIIH